MAKTLDEIFGAPAAPTAPTTNKPKTLDEIFAPSKATTRTPAPPPQMEGLPPNEMWEKTKGIMSGAAHAINRGYEAFTQLAPVKLASKTVGAVVGTAGAVVGTGVELMGAPVTEAIAMRKGKSAKEAVGEVWKGVKKQWTGADEQADDALGLAMPTAGQFGYKTGYAAAPAAMSGAAGRVLNMALAFGQGYTGYEDVKEGLKEKDWARVTAGVTALATAGVQGFEGFRPGKGGILLDPKFKRQLKAEVEGVRSTMTGDKRTPYARAVDNAADIYHQVLNPTKSEMTKLELGKGKDIKQITRIMAEEGVPIGKNAAGKLDTAEAIDVIHSKMDELAPKIEPILASKPIEYDLNDFRKEATSRIQEMKLSAVEKKARLADLNEIVDAEIEQRFGETWKEDRVRPIVPATEANNIKQGQWKMGYNAMKPTQNKTARLFGRVIKEAIDNDYADTKAIEINARISDLADAEALLTSAHGRVIKGGQMGRMISGLAGAVAGEGIPIPVVGPLIGKAAGEAIHSRFVDPTRLTESALKKMEQAKTNPLPKSIMKTAAEEGYIPGAASIKRTTTPSYRSAHQIDISNSTEANNIDILDAKEKIRKLNGYISNETLSDLRKLEKMQGNPNAKVTIYRASPKHELNAGDWVTTNRTYANNIKQQNGGRVYTYKVRVKDLRYPNDIESLPSMARASAFAYSPDTSKSERTPVAVASELPFEGFDDLSTKLLEKLKSRATVSRQFIEDLTNSGDLKQTERDLIRRMLPEGKNVNVKDFADRVRMELVPLKRVGGVERVTQRQLDVAERKAHTTGDWKEYERLTERNEESQLSFGSRYESVNLPEELRGKVKNYSEYIYNSPIKTSAGDVHFMNVDEAAEGYFAHSRVEDMADNKTRRVIEVQSDLFQKGRLEGEKAGATNRLRELGLEDEYGTLRMKKNPSPADTAREQEIERLMKEPGSRDVELAKLEPYRNTWWERVIREENKKAAQDGKSVLQFPTGETAMKIEGLGEDNPWRVWDVKYGSYSNIPEPKDLAVGLELRQAGEPWIITDVLGDGKFKAVTKNTYDRSKSGSEVFVEEKDQLDALGRSLEQYKETFDISGKVDQSNPIYKFYEKDVGKYLTNKFGAKRVKDAKGVEWWQYDVKKDAANLPVEAYALVPFTAALIASKVKEKKEQKIN